MNRILLAEDDNDMRRFLAKALANAGYDVVSYDNGRSAYERLREEPFTLLLTDIVMPEMDGIELARRATELDPDLKIMFDHRLRRRGTQPRQSGSQGRQGAVQGPSISRISCARSKRCWRPPDGHRQIFGRKRLSRQRVEGEFGKASQASCVGRERTLYPRPRHRRGGPAKTENGRVAQRESTTLTS